MFSNDPKDWSVKRITADQIISKKPCHVKWIIVESKNNKKGDAILYDGQSTGAELKVKFMVATGIYYMCQLDIPIYLATGCYINVGDDSEAVVICWQEESIK